MLPDASQPGRVFALRPGYVWFERLEADLFAVGDGLRAGQVPRDPALYIAYSEGVVGRVADLGIGQGCYPERANKAGGAPGLFWERLLSRPLGGGTVTRTLALGSSEDGTYQVLHAIQQDDGPVVWVDSITLQAMSLAAIGERVLIVEAPYFEDGTYHDHLTGRFVLHTDSRGLAGGGIETVPAPATIQQAIDDWLPAIESLTIHQQADHDRYHALAAARRHA